MNIIYYSSIKKALLNLEDSTRAKATKTIKLLEKFGYQLRLPYSKKVDSQLFELRTTGKEAIRIFYTIQKEDAILLHLFKKKSQKIPEKEITIARKRLESIITDKL